jgi:hypothetical protein
MFFVALLKISLTSNDMWIENYGNLYKKLTLTTGEIPIGIYRTLAQDEPMDVISVS